MNKQITGNILIVTDGGNSSSVTIGGLVTIKGDQLHNYIRYIKKKVIGKIEIEWLK